MHLPTAIPLWHFDHCFDKDFFFYVLITDYITITVPQKKTIFFFLNLITIDIALSLKPIRIVFDKWRL